MNGKRFGMLAATAGLVAGGLLGINPSAQATSTQCESSSSFSGSGSSYYVLPVHVTGSGFTYTCYMNPGVVTGNGVKALQRTLNACYAQSLTVDGVYGSKTKSALAFAQRVAGLPASAQDGIYGPQTRDAINWVRYNTGVPTTVCLKNVH